MRCERDESQMKRSGCGDRSGIFLFFILIFYSCILFMYFISQSSYRLPRKSRVRPAEAGTTRVLQEQVADELDRCSARD